MRPPWLCPRLHPPDHQAQHPRPPRPTDRAPARGAAVPAARARRYLRGKRPASLRTCPLPVKPARRLVEIYVAYSGFTIPDQFGVGYGRDYGELYRNLPFVGVLRPEVYSG